MAGRAAAINRVWRQYGPSSQWQDEPVELAFLFERMILGGTIPALQWGRRGPFRFQEERS